MEVSASSVFMKKALNRLLSTLTPAAKKDSFPIALKTMNDSIYLVGENKEFSIAAKVLESTIIEPGEVLLDGKLLSEFFKENKTKEVNIETIPEGTFLFDDEDEMTEWSPYAKELNTSWMGLDLPPVCEVKASLFYQSLKELKTMNIKSYHSASEHILFRLRGTQLNGRATNMKSVVTNSVQVKGFKNELTDVLLTNKQASKLSQFFDGVKEEPMMIRMNDESIRLETPELISLTKQPALSVTMPDVTKFTKVLDGKSKDSFQSVKLSSLLMDLLLVEKELKKIKDGPRIAKMQRNGSKVVFRESELEDSILINTKDLTKLLQSISKEDIEILIENQALYIVHTTPEVKYKSVLMLIKEEV